MLRYLVVPQKKAAQGIFEEKLAHYYQRYYAYGLKELARAFSRRSYKVELAKQVLSLTGISSSDLSITLKWEARTCHELGKILEKRVDLTSENHPFSHFVRLYFDLDPFWDDVIRSDPYWLGANKNRFALTAARVIEESFRNVFACPTSLDPRACQRANQALMGLIYRLHMQRPKYSLQGYDENDRRLMQVAVLASLKDANG